MPYQSIVDLPPAVSEHLPIHAREIFLAAFNNAFDQYAGRPDRKSAAFRVDWAAAKRKYRKIGDEWIEK